MRPAKRAGAAPGRPDAAAIVTGHTRGLGAAVAAELLARGARVLGIARHRNDGLARQGSGLLAEVALDLADAAALDRSARLRIAAVAPGVVDTDMQAEIRMTDEERFPDRRRFVALKREGKLLSPEQAGHAVVDYLLSDAFGGEPVTDLRDAGG